MDPAAPPLLGSIRPDIAESPGTGNGGSQLRANHPGHATLEFRVFDTEQATRSILIILTLCF